MKEPIFRGLIMAGCLAVAPLVYSQTGNVAINRSGNPSYKQAILDLSDVSNSRLGFLTTMVHLQSDTDATTINPPSIGMIVWNINASLPDGAGFYFWSGNAWYYLYNSGSPLPYADTSSSSNTRGNRVGTASCWAITGNSGLNSYNNWLGTNDTANLQFRVNNFKSGFISQIVGVCEIGYKSGYNEILSNTNYASCNTAFGNYALYSYTSAGWENTQGQNVAIGDSSLYSDYAGYCDNEYNPAYPGGISNIAIGYDAMERNTVGLDNIAIGNGALQLGTQACVMIAIGDGALYNAASWSNDDVAIGLNSFSNLTQGGQNTGLGTFAGLNAIGVNGDTYIGDLAGGHGFGKLYKDYSNYNTYVGASVGAYHHRGNANTVIGFDGWFYDSTGTNNALGGYEVALNDTNGSGNSVWGAYGMFNEIAGNYNSIFGYEANYSGTGFSNVCAFGNQALYNNTVSNVCAFGYDALYNSNANYVSAFGYEALYHNTTGISNTAMGYGALYHNSTGSGNSAYGFYAEIGIGGGSYNTAMGDSTLGNGINYATAYNNTAVGYGVLCSSSIGSSNTGIGKNALLKCTGTSNTAIGDSALFNITSGYDDLGIGYKSYGKGSTDTNEIVIGSHLTGNGSNSITFSKAAMAGTTFDANVHYNLNTGQLTYTSDTIGSGVDTGTHKSSASVYWADNNLWNLNGNSGTVYGTNYIGTTDANDLAFKVDGNIAGILQYGSSYFTALGYEAGGTASQVTGGYNTAVGYQALYTNTTGFDNTAIGYRALHSNVSGSSNTAFGYEALFSTTGSYNNAFGASSLYNNTTGSYNTAFGFQSMNSNTTGSSNTAFGYNSLVNNVSGNGNIAFGYDALYNNTGSYNDAIGYQSLYNNTTGSYNDAFGYECMNSNTTGQFNAAYGIYAMGSNSSGSYNVAFGHQSLYDNTTGGSNTSVGYNSLESNVTGSDNTAIGCNVLTSSTGSYNTSVGYQSSLYNTTGTANAAFGTDALEVNYTGSSNSAYGTSALARNTTGSHNSALGDSALFSNTTGNDNIGIGYKSQGNAATDTDEIVIGNYLTGNGSNSITFSKSAMTGTAFAPNVHYNLNTGQLTYTSDSTTGSNVSATTTATLTATGSTLPVMAGLGKTITPQTTGTVLVTVCGNMNNSANTDGGKVQIAYGSGSAPANGAAAAGTTEGSLLACALGSEIPFSTTCILSGLTKGTTYWVDLQYAAVGGGSISLSSVTVSLSEVK